MGQELTCKGLNTLFRPFDEEFLLHQRFTAPVLSARASSCCMPVQDLESRQLLKNLLTTDDFGTQLQCFSASIVYILGYGFRIETGEEWQIKTSGECVVNMLKACQVGAWIVESLPFLNYLPRPFTPWKDTAEGWHQAWNHLHITNLREALKREGWNWSKDFSNSKEADQFTEAEIAWDLGNLCDAGSETTSSVLSVFVLSCLAQPEWIPKAQEELDSVVGQDRLPTFEDLDNLPYIAAVIEETFRWRNIVPAGVPHRTTSDDYYKGYHIPKGSTIIPLFLAMRNDTSLHDSPDQFLPKRWINRRQSGNFGYGRRICPGRHIARNSVAIAIARMLWAFNIRSQDGQRPVIKEDDFTAGFVSHPKPFEAVFEPRSNRHKQVMEESWDMAEKDVPKILDGIRGGMTAAGLSPRA
jgi:hypothetical protein